MRTVLLAVLSAFFLSVGAHAQPATNTAAVNITPPPGVPATAAATVYVTSFGAVCNDVTDDTAAINAAVAYIRASQTSSLSTIYANLVFPAAKACKITSAINLTGLVGISVTIQGAGATIDCQSSAICLDALGSRFIRFNNFTLTALGAAVPTIGIQIGRTDTAANNSSDNHVFRDVIMNGSFGQAGIYNFSSETVLFDNVRIYNSNSGAGAYCLIQDGYNHFNAQSTFITQNAPVDTPQSFNEDTFVSLDLRNSGGHSALWLGNTSRHRFIGGYIGNTGGSGANAAVVLYGEGSSNNTMLDFDVHIESGSVTDAFLVSGSNTTPIFNGFKYRDHSTSATNSVFKADTTQSTVVMRGAQLEIGTYSGGSATLLDIGGHAASIWTFSGASYWSAAITQFNAVNWQGPVGAAQSGTSIGLYGASLAGISAQYPDATTAGGNARGANAVDLQTIRSGAGQVASGANAAVVGGSGNTATGQYAGSVGGFANFANGIASGVVGGEGNAFTGLASGTVGGLNGNDHGVTATLLYAAGQQTSGAVAQWGVNVLRGTTTNGSTLILTSTNTGSTSATNCANMPVNKQYSFVALLNAHNTTSPATKSWSASWGYAAGGPHILSIGATIGTAVIDGVTSTIAPDGSRAIGTLTGIGATIQADTTSGCPKVIVTPPTSTTDTWEWTVVVERVE